VRFAGETILVTGGTSGIGLATAQVAAEEGARVVLIGRDPQRGNAAAAMLVQAGYEAHYIAADVALPENCRRAVEQCVAITGQIDVLVNNAGGGEGSAGVQPADSLEVRWQKLIDVNLSSAYYMSTYALPWLQASVHGAIVNVSSTAAIHGNYGIYSTAKAGLEGLTRTLAVDCAAVGVRVNCVSPGWIATPLARPVEIHADEELRGEWERWEAESCLLGRMGEPTEIAHAILFMASPQASFITGTVLVADGGLSIVDMTAAEQRRLRSMAKRKGSHS
jgi:NAD(P)-dependent dehydrogenase (short-subunit alcohol dehydrogenase family)